MGIERFFTQIAKLQRNVRVSNNAGSFRNSWVDIRTLDGRLDGVSGNEQLVAHKITHNSTHIWFCEVIEDITTDDRIVVDDVVYDIIYIDDPVYKGNHLEIFLERKEIEQL